MDLLGFEFDYTFDTTWPRITVRPRLDRQSFLMKLIYSQHREKLLVIV
jgi:hypothetical protein